MKLEKAAFSKSVKPSSMVRNSTRHWILYWVKQAQPQNREISPMRVGQRRRLESHGIPVGAPEILHVVCLSLVVDGEFVFKDDQRVPNKQVSNVPSHLEQTFSIERRAIRAGTNTRESIPCERRSS